MVRKERVFWLFLVGLLLGTLNVLVFYPLHSSSIPPSPLQPKTNLLKDKEPYPLISLLETYLTNYYWDTEKLNQENLLFGAVQGLYEATGDPYTTVYPPSLFQEFFSDISGNIAGIGIYLQKKNNHVSILSVIPNSPATQRGLRRGDRVLSINDIPIDNFSIEEISHQIQGSENTWVTLHILRPSTQSYRDIKIQRTAVSIPSIYQQALPKNLRYLKIMDFNDHTLSEIQKILPNQRSTSGLVIDLRENPGGQLEVANSVASLFLPKGTLITTLIGKNSKKLEEYRTDQNPIFPKNKPIVVLAGPQTASAAEILAAALSENRRAVIVGEKTFGKGSVQTIFPLSYNGEDFGVKITVAHYLTSLGHDINHVGINPDIKVNFPDISSLDQEKISFILNHNILEEDLGKELEKPLSLNTWKMLLLHLKEKELSVPPPLLKRIIQEQKNLSLGKIHTVEWEFDTQLARALELLGDSK